MRDGVLVAGVVVLASALAGCGASAWARSECRLDPREVYQRVSGSVVAISAVGINPTRGADRFQRAEGSGFVIGGGDRGTFVATNAHVVMGAQSLLLTFADGTRSEAAVIGLDPIFDIALLGVPPGKGERPAAIEMGESADLQPGETVVALGNPFGLFHTLTAGVVSAIDRVLPAIPFTLSEPYIQIDTSINPGNSGGPLLDLCARAVGMNTAVIAGANNIGFAIPIDQVKRVLPQLARDGRVIRPWIGFHGQFIDDSLSKLLKLPLAPGFLVEHVEHESPAHKAGLRGGQLALTLNGHEYLLGGDIILAVNGRSAAEPRNALQAVFEIKVNDPVTLRVFRGGERLDVRYRAAERPLLPSDVAGLIERDTTLPPTGAVPGALP